jgi:hypothetical protein
MPALPQHLPLQWAATEAFPPQTPIRALRRAIPTLGLSRPILMGALVLPEAVAKK